MQKFPDSTKQQPGRYLRLRFLAAGLAAFTLGSIPGATVGLSVPSQTSTCSAREDVPLTESPDSLELALAVFPCATKAVVVSQTASDDELRASVELAISSNAPLFVSSAERQPELDAALDGLDTSEFVNTPATARSSGETFESRLRKPGSNKTYVLPTSPTANQMALIPSLNTIGTDIAFAEPGNEQQLAAIGPSSAVTFASDFGPTDRWIAERSQTLPGGGFQLFPKRRIVALYGHPSSPVLGLLGEQNPQATVDRLTAMLPSYEAAGVPTIGGFEIISTIATASPGDDGNYSREMDVETLRPWIEIAAENEIYVILDLQPGRTDFLTQAKLYEEFLKLPHVGLALDPEWRLLPDQVHLRQIGGVDAHEVNEVVEYLTQLVRDNGLPQKALVLHQFQLTMLRDRATIKTPPELAVVVHVDGQGPLGSKYGTWDNMRSDPVGADQTLWWGWKNFIDEDLPTATPEQVNEVDPLPVVVTYQ